MRMLRRRRRDRGAGARGGREEREAMRSTVLVCSIVDTYGSRLPNSGGGLCGPEDLVHPIL
jgi:hypothetical protein